VDHEERTSDLGFVATKHVVRRVRRRMGLPKRAVIGEIEKAYKYGRRIEEFSGRFREHLDSIRSNKRGANKIIVYRNFMFLINERPDRNDRILTAYHVPQEYRRLVKRNIK